MSIFPTKRSCCVLAGLSLLAVCLSVAPAWGDDARDASFLPPPTSLVERAAPEQSSPEQTPSHDATQDSAAPDASPNTAYATTSDVRGRAVPPDDAMPPQVTAPPSVPPISLGKPVMSTPLTAVDPDSLGLLHAADGGFDVDLWSNTSRALVNILLPALPLPTSSATLNNLARRLLPSVAAAPTGSGDEGRSLTTLRVGRLLALGDTDNAWRLARLATFDALDKDTALDLVENALTGPSAKDVCAMTRDLVARHNEAEWQRPFLFCQWKDGDAKAVQLGLDLMQEQPDKDSVFVTLMNRALLHNPKNLPRQLTPLRPLNLALLRALDIPMPSELYGRPDAALIPALLQAPAARNDLRLALAEKAAAQGLITNTDLAAVYTGVVPATGAASSAAASGPSDRAALFQALGRETDPAVRTDLLTRFLQSLAPSALTGGMGALVADLLNTVPQTSAQAKLAPFAARALAMAGQPDRALLWIKLARDAATQDQDSAHALLVSWPIFALSGLVVDTDYAPGLNAWLDDRLSTSTKDTSTASVEDRHRRSQASAIVLLLNAAGFAIPENALLRVMNVVPDGKYPESLPLAAVRMREAGTAKRVGETVLLAVLLAGGSDGNVSLSVAADAVRALRQADLRGDAQSLAREIAASVLAAG